MDNDRAMSIFSPVFSIIVVSLSTICSFSFNSADDLADEFFFQEVGDAQRGDASLFDLEFFQAVVVHEGRVQPRVHLMTMAWVVCISFSRNSLASLASPICSCSWDDHFPMSAIDLCRFPGRTAAGADGSGRRRPGKEQALVIAVQGPQQRQLQKKNSSKHEDQQEQGVQPRKVAAVPEKDLPLPELDEP